MKVSKEELLHIANLADLKIKDDEIDNYIALIVQKSNPKLESIIQDFDEFIGFLGVKPE